MVKFIITTKQITMNRSTNFSGQSILNQLIMFLDKDKIRKLAMQNDSNKLCKEVFYLQSIYIR